jgi:hypothetical protein
VNDIRTATTSFLAIARRGSRKVMRSRVLSQISRAYHVCRFDQAGAPPQIGYISFTHNYINSRLATYVLYLRLDILD